MSTNEELVQRAEAAAQEAAAIKVEVEELVDRIETIQIPAIQEATEDIRQAINEKGVNVPEETHLADYGDKIRSIQTGSGGGGGGEVVVTGEQPQVWISNDERIRFFQIDCSERIHTVQEPTSSGNLLAINNKAFRIFGPADKPNAKAQCSPVCTRTDVKAIYYLGDANYILLTTNGSIYHIYYHHDVDTPVSETLITSEVDEVCPASQEVFYVRKGTTVEVYYRLGEWIMHASTTGVKKFLMQYAEPAWYSEDGIRHGTLCESESGEMLVLWTALWEDYAEINKKSVCAAPSEGEWKEVKFEPWYGDDYEGGSVKCIFAITTNGDIYSTRCTERELGGDTGNLEFTRIEGITGARNIPGYAETALNYWWDEETGEDGYKAYTSRAAFVVDGRGQMFRIIANIDINGWDYSFSGLRVDPVLQGNKCSWVHGSAGRNDRMIAQLDNNIALVTTDNTDDLNVSISKGAHIDGEIKHAWSPADGDWCVICFPTE